MGEAIRLNLGAGSVPLDGYTPIDRKLGSEVYPLAYDDGTVDEIRASHVLEHFPHGQTLTVLKHWADKLKPGGVLKIAVPDFAWVAEQYLAGAAVNVQGYVMGGQTDGDDHHGAIFDASSLKQSLIGLGLERIGRWTSEIADCASLPVSLNLCGYKPTGDGKVTNTRAVLSAPRYGPVAHFKHAIAAMEANGVPYYLMQGAYWHQAMSELIRDAMEAGCKYVITCDYDSILTAADVRELYRLMEADTEADAIAAVQMKRLADSPLFTIIGANGELVKQLPAAALRRPLLPVASAHFGLTIIRCSSLVNLSRPWLMPAPDQEGHWTPGSDKIDADMAFWRNARAANWHVYLAPRVVVGHIQEVIAWPGADLKPVYQELTEYEQNGADPRVMR